MKGFLQDILRLTGLPEEAASYKYIAVGGKSLYVDGVKFIKAYSPEEIVVALKRGSRVLTVAGEGLVIERLSADDMLISGSIIKTELV